MSAEFEADVGAPTDCYTFDPDFRVPPVAHGTSIVVRGDPEAAPGALAMRLLTPTSQEFGGTLLIETDDTYRGVATRWTNSTDVPLSRLAVVSCDGGQHDNSGPLGACACVSQPSDLTGLGIQYTKLARSFTEGPRGRLRVGLDSISTLQMFCDDVQTVYRFLHTLTGRIRTTGQLGIFVFNPEMHDPRVTNIVTQPFDAAVDVRVTENGQREVKITGVAGHDPAWTPV